MKPETEWIITVLYAITMLVAFAGNSFLIYIVWKKPEVRSLTSFMFVDSLTRFVYSQLVCPLLVGIFKEFDYLQHLFSNLIEMSMRALWGIGQKGNTDMFIQCSG